MCRDDTSQDRYNKRNKSGKCTAQPLLILLQEAKLKMKKRWMI